MDEGAWDAGIAAVAEGLPPAVEGHLDHPTAEALDGSDLGVGRRVGSDHGARDPQPARVPGRALGHVAGARREHACRQLPRAQLGHDVGRPADLEGADRLQVLELEIDLRLRVPEVEPHQRGADRGPHHRRPGVAKKRPLA